MVIAADNNLVEGCNVVVPVELTDSYFDAVDIHNRVDTLFVALTDGPIILFETPYKRIQQITADIALPFLGDTTPSPHSAGLLSKEGRSDSGGISLLNLDRSAPTVVGEGSLPFLLLFSSIPFPTQVIPNFKVMAVIV